MSSSLLSLGTNALNANQRALANVGRNIANVNSEGYSRNVTVLSEQGVPRTGVNTDVRRMTDQFMVQQVWKDMSSLSNDQTVTEKMQFLDSIVGSMSNNISTKLDQFFSAMHQVADEPMLMSARQLFLSESDVVAKTFNTIDAKMQDQNDLILSELNSSIANINQLAISIADFNYKIEYQEKMGQTAFEMLDERDLLVKELSSMIGISVVQNSDNNYEVFVGQGQPLVIGSTANTMKMLPGSNDPNKPLIFLDSPKGVSTDITDQIYGGEVSGLIDYRDNVLGQARSEIGRLAIVFANTINDQNRSGVDINGNRGSNIFNEMSSGKVLVNTNNQASNTSAQMSFYDSSELTTSDYSMTIGKPDMAGNPTFEIRRQSDGKVFKSTQLTEVGSLPATNTLGIAQNGVYQVSPTSMKVSIDGFTVSINASTISEGDKFELQPTQGAASYIKTVMRRPEQVAAASPVRTYEGKNNNGTAVISSVEVLNTMDSAPLRMGNATLPLEVRVTGPNALMEYSLTVYDNSSPGAPVAIPSLTGLVYEEGMEIEFEGYKFSIDGVVANGDSYFIEKNTGGKSDNTNFLQMIDLQMAEIVDGNNYQDAYGEMLSWVGIKAQNAELSFKSSTSALSTSESSLESTRGVNLDEEAAKLVKFQQAYSAAAQLITAQQTIFNSLLGAVRG